MVVVLAQEARLSRSVRPPALPLLEVVAVGEKTWAQPGNTQWRSRRQTSRRWVAVGSARPAPRRGCGPRRRRGRRPTGVTEQAPDHVRADEPAPFEFARQRRLGVAPDLEGHVGHHQRAAPSRAPATLRAEQETKASARRWSRGVSPSEPIAWPRLERQHAPRRRRRGGNWATMVREASLKRNERRSSSSPVRGPGRPRLGAHQRPEILKESSSRPPRPSAPRSRAWPRRAPPAPCRG